MSNQLIAVNEKQEQLLKDKLSKYKMFGTPEQFIALYNSGVINSSNDLIKDIADSLEEAYVNVSRNSKRILIRSLEEVAAENISELIKGWEILSKIKRFANYLAEESYPADTKIIFSNSRNPGTPLIEVPTLDKETGEVKEINLDTHWASEKITSSTADLLRNKVAAVYMKKYENDDDCIYLNMFDLVDLDNSFLVDIQDLLLEKTFRG